MTREELEARRMEAIPLLDAGVMQSIIARRFGVSRTSVTRWKQMRAKGDSLARHKTTGRPPRLTVADVEKFKIYAPFGFHGTTEQFAQLIYLRTGVRYSSDHVGKLIHKWGLRPKRERKCPKK